MDSQRKHNQKQQLQEWPGVLCSMLGYFSLNPSLLGSKPGTSPLIRITSKVPLLDRTGGMAMH